MSPMTAAPVSDFPAPDSPTTPSTSPGAMSNEMSWTARSVPWRVGNSTHKFETASNGPGCGPACAAPESVAI